MTGSCFYLNPNTMRFISANQSLYYFSQLVIWLVKILSLNLLFVLILLAQLQLELLYLHSQRHLDPNELVHLLLHQAFKL